MQYIHWVSIFTYALIYYMVDSVKCEVIDRTEGDIPPGAVLAVLPVVFGLAEMYKFWCA